MTFGPCGGVRADGACEVMLDPCVFLDGALPVWARGEAPAQAPRTPAAQELLDLAARRPLVVADLPSIALDADSLRACADAVAGRIDAALMGDTPWDRVQLPPALRARLVAEQGVRPWSGLNCRDRNRVALEGELAGLAAAGAAAVHCVTGDHTVSGERADAMPVFDLDSTALAARAAQTGLVVSVAESPGVPPAAERPARVASKQAAGADTVILNQAGGPDAIADFVAQLKELTTGLRVLACIPLAISERSLALVARFAGPEGPSTALGTAAAVAAGEAMLAVDGVDGVELTVVAAPGEELQTAQAIALVGEALGASS